MMWQSSLPTRLHDGGEALLGDREEVVRIARRGYGVEGDLRCRRCRS